MTLSRSTPLRQKTPLKRSAWNKKPPVERGPGLAHRVAQALGTVFKPTRKEPSVFRSEKHLNNVRCLPCVRCGKRPRSQAAHLNLQLGGKGMGVKASDALTVPLCADGFLYRGCHSQFDQGALYPKDTAAAVSVGWLQETRTLMRRLGTWEVEAEADVERFLAQYLRRDQ